MRNPLDPFSKVLDERSHWDPEWYSWLTDISKTTTQLETELAAQTAINVSQAAAITALQNQPVGLVFIQSQVASNTAIIVFTGLNSSLYEAYQFHITGISPAALGGIFVMQMSNNGGVSWLNTSNIWTWLYSYMGGGSTPNAYSSTVAGDQSSFYIASGPSLPWGMDAEVSVYPSIAGDRLNMAKWHSIIWQNNAGGAYQVLGGGNEVSNSSPVNAVRFFFGASGGNMTKGRISMYGLRKT